MKTERRKPGSMITNSEASVSKRLSAEGPERISNATLRRNVTIVWSVFLSFIFIFSLPFVSYLHFTETVAVLISRAIYVLLLCLILFWTARLRIRMTNKPFSTAPADSKFHWFFCHAAYRPGRYVGIKLCADVSIRPYHHWVAQMADFVLKEPCTPSRPLILRSHLLSNSKIRELLTERLLAAGMCCRMRSDLPVLFPFLLKWVTPAVMVLGGKLPAMYAREWEIIVTPEHWLSNSAASAVN